MALVLNGSNDTITGLQINSANIVNGSITADDLATGVGGKILQVVSATKTDVQSFNSESFADISGLTATITLSSSSNKVFIMVNLYTSQGSVASIINFVRDSTNIAQPSGTATREATMFGYNSNTLNMHQRSMSFLDTVGDTNAHTYKLQLKCTNTNNAVYVNRYYGSDDYYGISTLTLMEVAV